MRPLALDDMGTHESDTAMDELTEQLRLEAQKQTRARTQIQPDRPKSRWARWSEVCRRDEAYREGLSR